MMKKQRLIILAIITLGCVPVGADSGIYKHTDEQGRITYQNKSVNGGKKLSVAPALSKQRVSRYFYPSVDKKTQKKRDNKRREILENELAAEKKLLTYARKVLSKVHSNAKNAHSKISQSDVYRAKYQAKVKSIENKVRLHERNIAALKKELANL